MAVYDFQAISTPIMESIQQHGAQFSACAETLPGETSWLPSRDPAVSGQAMGARLLNIHCPETSIFSYTISRAKAAFFSQIQMQKVPLGLKHYLLLPNSPNTGVICPVAQDRSGWSSPLSAWRYQPSGLEEAQREKSVNLRMEFYYQWVCASGHLQSLFVNKYIRWWKENKSYIFFHVVMGPWRSNTKILLSI